MPRAVSFLAVAFAIVIVLGACSSGAASMSPPSDSAGGSPAASVAGPAASTAAASASPATVCPTSYATPDPTPYPTPAASIDPKAPATVWGAQPNGTIISEGTWTKTKTGQGLRGYEETLELNLSDARVNGKATFHYSIDLYETAPGMDVKTIFGDMRIDAAAGTWEGRCRGTMWIYKEWVTSCWLSGKGAYAGMTFVYNLIHMEPGELLIRGQIYPGPIPS